MYTTAKINPTGATHRVTRRTIGAPVVLACGRRLPERDLWAAGGIVTCRACQARETCERGHESCGTRETCARLASVPMTVDAAGHRRGARVLLADGRTPEVRYAMFHASTVTLVYTAGPSDTYRRGTVLDVLL